MKMLCAALGGRIRKTCLAVDVKGNSFYFQEYFIKIILYVKIEAAFFEKSFRFNKFCFRKKRFNVFPRNLVGSN